MKHVLISGGGIAGLTLGLCLDRAGIACTVVEQSPGPRSGGYMIDFFGSGYDAAERLGLLNDLESIHYPIAKLAFLDGRGREKFAVPYPELRKLFDNHHFNFMRGELEGMLLSKVCGAIDIRYGTTIRSFEENSAGIEATLSDGSTMRADLVVGADGIHSRIRTLAFGPESDFIHFLGCNTAAFVLENPSVDLEGTHAFDTVTIPGRQVAIYPIRGNRLATFFVHLAPRPHSSAEPAIEQLRRVYAKMNWIVPKLLESAPPDIYFDSVSQIRMPRWSKGRIALTGDAAWCVSLMAGQGASMAMAGSYILAEELSAPQNDLAAALRRYEERLRPSIAEKQLAGQKMAKWFVPGDRVRLAIRDAVMRFSGFRNANRILKGLFATSSVFATPTPPYASGRN
ncbi:MAG TPA: FAD-dependent monooxygenase [Bryobacteraceae bacterium]|nr:FAD-dependent monooxygenase [Bryobacteraceae bacterium]